MITNASYEGKCNGLNEKTTQQWVSLFKFSHEDLLFNDFFFEDFALWLLGYRVEFSCLKIPQNHYFIRQTDRQTDILFDVY